MSGLPYFMEIDTEMNNEQRRKISNKLSQQKRRHLLKQKEKKMMAQLNMLQKLNSEMGPRIARMESRQASLYAAIDKLLQCINVASTCDNIFEKSPQQDSYDSSRASPELSQDCSSAPSCSVSQHAFQHSPSTSAMFGLQPTGQCQILLVVINLMLFCSVNPGTTITSCQLHCPKKETHPIRSWQRCHHATSQMQLLPVTCVL